MSAQMPIRVLHVTFNMGIGGTEQVIRQLILASNESELRHEVVCIDGHIGSMGEELQSRGIDVHVVSRTSGFDWSLLKALRLLISQQSIDVVHCHQYTPFIYGRLAAFMTSAKVIFTEHGRFHPDRYRYKAIIVNRVLAWMTSEIVAISKATRDALAQYEFIPKSRIKVIYNGINPLPYDLEISNEIREGLGIPEGAFVIGTVSRLEPIKNQEMALRCFEAIYRNYPQAWMVLVGDGTDREKLENLSKKLGLGSRVRFTGYISSPAHHIGFFDVFVLPSFTEGTSMTLLEAMSLGIPCVASKVGGTPEVIAHNKNGVLFDLNSPEQFIGALGELIKDRDWHRELSEGAAREFKSRFSSQVMMEKYLSYYKTLCHMQGPYA